MSQQQERGDLSQPDGNPATSVEDAIRSRRSIRAYSNKPVDRAILEDILILANQAPSGSNIQPWRVFVLMGQSLERVGQRIQTAFLTGESGHKRDYAYYTDPLFEPYLARRRACGWGMYDLLGIKKGDNEKMREQRSKNYVFFGAPVGLIFTIDKRLERGSWIDYGMFMQNIMVLSRSYGLHTCPQASLGEFPDIVRSELDIPENQIVVAGMSLGYADLEDPINKFQPVRQNISDFVTYWY